MNVLESTQGVAVMVIDIDIKGSLHVIHQLTSSSPALVVIAVTKNADMSVAQSLINHGQVFKYMIKPLGHTRTENVLQEALLRHDELVRSPGSYRRLPEPMPASRASNSGIMRRLVAMKEKLFR